VSSAENLRGEVDVTRKEEEIVVGEAWLILQQLLHPEPVHSMLLQSVLNLIR
jgi:hypothetical protein